MSAVIGSLRVDLGLNSAEFSKGLKVAQTNLANFGARMQGIGVAMSAALTLPALALAKSSLDAFQEQAAAMGAVNAVIKSMGTGAGRTAEQLDGMADALEASSTFTGDEILTKVSANLLTFSKVQGEVFDRAQQAAVDLSARLGSDLQSSAVMVGKALQDPIKGITALTRVGVSFTAEQKAMIEQMVKVGDVAGAQRLILSELERQYGGQAAAAQAATGGVDELKDSWGKFEETIGAIVAEVLPPLTEALRGVVDWLRTADPALVRVGVQVVAVGAVLGPLALTIGTVTSALALLTPAIGALSAALIALTGPAGAIALVIAGLATLGVVAHNTWSSINNALQAGAGGPLDDYLGQLDDVRAGLKELEGFADDDIAPVAGAPTILEQRNVLLREEAGILAEIKRRYQEIDSASARNVPATIKVPTIEVGEVVIPEIPPLEIPEINLPSSFGGAGTAVAGVTDALKEGTEAAEAFGDRVNGAFAGVGSSIAGLLKGTKDLGEVLLDVAAQVLPLLNFGAGGGGGPLGNLLQGVLSGLGGFAKGTDYAPRGYAWVGEEGPELMKFRGGERVIPNNQLGGGMGNSAHVTFGVDVDGSGNLIPVIRKVSRSEVQQATPKILNAAGRQVKGVNQTINRRGAFV